MDGWTFEAELWSSESVASWVFLTVPPEVGEDVACCPARPPASAPCASR